MSVDLSALDNLQNTEPLDLPLYQSRSAAKPFPKAGRYTARTRDEFPATTFGVSKAGALTADVSPTIVGGDYDGFTVNYTKVSAKTWTNKQGVVESQLGRYLKACGVNEKISGSPQAQADAVASTAGKLVEISVDWQARDFANGFELKGMANFPIDPKTGQPSRTVLLDGKDGRPTVIDPITLEPKAVRAFLEVTRWSELAQ